MIILKRPYKVEPDSRLFTSFKQMLISRVHNPSPFKERNGFFDSLLLMHLCILLFNASWSDFLSFENFFQLSQLESRYFFVWRKLFQHHLMFVLFRKIPFWWNQMIILQGFRKMVWLWLTSTILKILPKVIRKVLKTKCILKYFSKFTLSPRNS